jgi:glycerol kinase
VASHTEKLNVSRPHPLWSEQDPEHWWQATDRAMKALGAQHSLREVKALGIAGQMHGATLLDKQQRVLRPAILWNDGRCGEVRAAGRERQPFAADNRQPDDAGFTAPKLLWVQRHEPEIFSQVDKVLLPKDYLRLRMTGEFASDMSDAAGTMWLDVARRDWSDEMLAACGLSRDNMPALFEGCEVTGRCARRSRRRGICRRRWWWPAAATTRRVRWASAWRMRVRRCCRWGPPASILPSATAFSASRKARYTVSAMRCRALAFDVGDAERGFLPRLGGEINRPRHGSGADCGGGSGE